VKERFQPQELLTPGEVAVMFRVDPKTVHRWERDGLFPEGAVFRTPGGHRRYKADAIRALLDGGEQR
jgi:DNA-binding transcriptional MerR regulator